MDSETSYRLIEEKNDLKNFNIEKLSQLVDYVKKMPKKEEVEECHLCSSSTNPSTVHELFKIYASMIHCLSKHSTEFIKNEEMLLTAFYFENFVLDEILDTLTVEEVLNREESMVLDRESIKDQLIATAKSFYMENSLNINCEQEIESLNYKIYTLLKEKDIKEVGYVLSVLSRRKESTRFFKIFDGLCYKTLSVYRLALLLSLNSDCCKSTNSLLREIKGATFKEANDIFMAASGSLNFQEAGHPEFYIELTRNLAGLENYPHSMTDVWFNEASKRYNWNECLKIWANSRLLDEGSVDASMIEICLKHKKYNEGWAIFQSLLRKNTCVVKMGALCLSALKATDDEIWIQRVNDVLLEVINNKQKNVCCAIAKDILKEVSSIEEDRRRVIVSNLMEILNSNDLSKEEEVVSCLMNGFLTICKECKNNGACNVYAEYAAEVYAEWKKREESGNFLFFKKKSSALSPKIYSCMLGVCDESRDCSKFYNVCKDLISSNAEIDGEIICRLEKFHKEKMCECNLFQGGIRNKKSCRSLLKHMLLDME